MRDDIVLDIFIFGLVLLPALILLMPISAGKIFKIPDLKGQLPMFSITISLIFLFNFKANLLGNIIIGVSMLYFFYLYGAAISSLKSQEVKQP